MKLGRLPAKRSYLIPALGRYIRALPLDPPPAACPPPALAWPMSLNNSIGDCTVAALAHCIQRWNGKILTDAQVLAMYEQIGGYNPANPSTDQGCAETDVLTAWVNGGFAEDRLNAYVSLNIADLDEIKDAINWFGCAYIGINLPQSAESNTALWDVVDGSPIAGGHAVILVGYDTQFFYCVSWGMLIKTTPAFLAKYLEEAYALLDFDWVQANGTTPNGLNLVQLESDMSALK